MTRIVPPRALGGVALVLVSAAPLLASCDQTQPPSTAPNASAASIGADVRWLSVRDGVAFEPGATLDATGTTWTAWIDFADGRPRLDAARVADDGTSVVGTLATGAAWYANPTLCSRRADDGTLNVLCAWQENGVDGAALVATTIAFEAGELVFGARELVLAGRAHFPQLVTTNAGSFELLCVAPPTPEGEHQLVHVARTASNEPSWSAPARLGTAGDAWNPRAVAGGDGRVHVVWDTFIDGRFTVHYGVLTDGAFTDYVGLVSGAGYQGFPSIALEPSGAAWVAWEEAEQFGEIGGLRARRSLGLARIEDGEASFADPASLPAPEERGDLPRVAWSSGGLVITFRGLGPTFAAEDDVHAGTAARPAEPRANVYLDPKARFYTAWWTRVLTFGADGAPEVVELPITEGDNEATETLLATESGVRAVFAADRRSVAEPRPSAYASPIESRWRVGLVDLPPARGVPRLGGPRSLPPIPPLSPTDVRATLDGERRVVYGDLHRHTQASRCSSANDGTLLDVYRYARGPGALDFVAVTDHFQHLQPWAWWRNLRDVDRFHAPGRLVVFAGIERAGKERGHRNDVYLDATDVPFDPELWNAFPEAVHENAPDEPRVSIPHMMGREESAWQWRWHDDELHTVVEVYQGARGSYEGPGLPYQASDLDVPRARVGRGIAGGDAFGLIAASDHASSASGLAGVYATELTRASVFEALRNRATFAATDFVRVDASLGALRPGEAGPAPLSAPLILRARGLAPVAAVEIVKNGESWQYHGGETTPEELVVLTTRRFGPYPNRPLVLSAQNASLVYASPRARGATEATLEDLGGGRLALSKQREPLDVVLWISPEGAGAALELALGDESLEVPLDSIPLGRSVALDAPVDREQLWRIGPSLGVEELLLGVPDPERVAGDSYYARVAFEDGNVAWTSPIRVTETTGEPR